MQAVILFVLLLLASPAWGAGNAFETLCGSPGGGVTCLCSEPLTADNGLHCNASGCGGDATVPWNPVGSNTYECDTGGNAMTYIGINETAESVLTSSVTPNAITVGGSGYVMKFEASTRSRYRVHSEGETFTDGTLCQRHYAYYDNSYVCDNPAKPCKMKGPRMDNGNSQWPQPGLGFQVAVLGTTSNPFWKHEFPGPGVIGGNGNNCPAAFPNCNSCKEVTGGYGCVGSGAGRMPITSNPNSLDFLNMQGAWFRWEICFDHNITENQLDSMNTAYGTSIPWPGADRVYARAKQTVVSGSRDGQEIFYGPVMFGHSLSSITTGSRFWMASTASGSPNSATEGDFFTAYNLVTLKTVSDPEYWPGGAEEEEPSGPTPTPSATPTATATPTGATPTATPTSTPTPAPLAQELFCPDGNSPNLDVIFCDNFDSGEELQTKWSNAYHSEDNVGWNLTSSVGIGGSRAMQA